MPAATTHQLALADSLGIEQAENLAVERLVAEIEAHLSQDTVAELARWYLLSVLRQLSKADWESPDGCGLDSTSQQELVASYLDSDQAKQALRAVLKEPHTRFTLLGFAKARKVEQHVLSSTTKAYKSAAALLEQAGLLTAPATKTATSGAASRREARRRQTPSSPSPSKKSVSESAKEDSALLETLSAAEAGMGDEEFARFDALINAAPPPAPNWREATAVDRQSLLYGLGAGAVLFLLIVLTLLFY